jgi:hypothetical protein
MNPKITIPWKREIKTKGTIFKFSNHDAELVVYSSDYGYMYQSLIVKVGENLFVVECWGPNFDDTENLILRLDCPVYKFDKEYYICGENYPIANENQS